MVPFKCCVTELFQIEEYTFICIQLVKIGCNLQCFRIINISYGSSALAAVSGLKNLLS